MKFFADTANLTELRELDEMGLICGITTNPTIISQTGRDMLAVLAGLSKEFPDYPVFGQVIAAERDGIIKEAEAISGTGKNIVVKIPATTEGAKAIHALKKNRIKTCATAVLTAAQGFLCATAGAAYVAPYTGQNDVIGFRGLTTLEELSKAIHDEGLEIEVLAASLKKPQEIIDCALAGADIATIPYHVFIDAFNGPKPLTDYYVGRFYENWSAAGCYIGEK